MHLYIHMRLSLYPYALELLRWSSVFLNFWNSLSWLHSQNILSKVFFWMNLRMFLPEFWLVFSITSRHGVIQFAKSDIESAIHCREFQFAIVHLLSLAWSLPSDRWGDLDQIQFLPPIFSSRTISFAWKIVLIFRRKQRLDFTTYLEERSKNLKDSIFTLFMH